MHSPLIPTPAETLLTVPNHSGQDGGSSPRSKVLGVPGSGRPKQNDTKESEQLWKKVVYTAASKKGNPSSDPDPAWPCHGVLGRGRLPTGIPRGRDGPPGLVSSRSILACPCWAPSSRDSLDLELWPLPCQSSHVGRPLSPASLCFLLVCARLGAL